MNTMSIVTGIGVDKTESPNQVLVTFQIIKPDTLQSSSPEGSKGGGKAYWNASSTGETIFATAREITHQMGKKLFFGHSEIIIVGRGLAEGGLQKTMDFFLRNTEMRPISLLLIASGTAADVLNTESEANKLPTMNIMKTVKGFSTTSQLKAITIHNFADRLLSKTTSPIAPLVTITERGTTKSIYIAGLAVFKKDKMVGTLNKIETRGLLWVTGDIGSGLISVDSSDGKGKIGLEILRAKSKVTPEVKDGNITMHIKIQEEGALTEQTTPENLATVPALAWLEQCQAEAIRQEIFAAFNKSKELNADIFGFGDIVHQRLPDEWQVLEDHWSAAYPSITLIVDIEAKILRTNASTTSVSSEK